MFNSNVFRSFTIAISCAAVLVSSQAVPNCARNYTVKAGDFCDKISAEQNVSTSQLATVNNQIIDPPCDNLFIGEVLCLGLVGHDCRTVHVVQNGDGCDTITAQAGITFGDLLANNPNVDVACSNIYVGEVLCVAPGNSTAPAGSSTGPVGSSTPSVSSTGSVGSSTPSTPSVSSTGSAGSSTPGLSTTGPVGSSTPGLSTTGPAASSTSAA